MLLWQQKRGHYVSEKLCAFVGFHGYMYDNAVVLQGVYGTGGREGYRADSSPLCGHAGI